MANHFKDPMYVFPVDGQDGSAARNAASSRAETPGQTSLTEVFAGPATPTLRTTDAGRATPGLYDVLTHDRAIPRSPRADNVISVVTRDGDELHYPVVHGRAGGSIHGQSSVGTEPLGVNAAARADVAARAHRHASLVAPSVSAHFGTAAETEETAEERAAAYQQSRATPSSIQRHRRSSSRGCSRSPPPALALRGEAVEETVRATSSQLPSASSSLANTPRQSLRRTPASTPLHELSSLDGGLGTTVSTTAAGAADRRSHAVIDGVAVRVEETGVSTPEMAEYFAEGAVEAQMRHASSSGNNPFGSSSSSLPSRRGFVTPRHSLQLGSQGLPPHPQAESGAVNINSNNNSSSGSPASAAGPRVNHFMLDRLMHLMEEQSRVSQQLLQRMDSLESANKTLVDRLSKLETVVETGACREEMAARLSAAESASPSVTRTSGSMDSAARPSTRAPSKAVN